MVITIAPTRMPGDMILEKLARYTTQPSLSKLLIVGRDSPSYLRS